MALPLHFNGVASLQNVCHTRSSFPSSTTSTTGAFFRGVTTNACTGSFQLSKLGTYAPESQSRPPPAVRCAATATKEVSVDKGPKYDEKELPPLLASLEMEGFPPCRGSVYADEALAYILKLGPADLFEDYYIVCTSFVSFGHCGAVSAERLATMAAMCTWMTFLDDILIDEPDSSLLEKLGLDPTMLSSPERIWQYFCALNAIMAQEAKPANPSTVEDMTWKIGRNLRALTPNREWFNLFIDAVIDFRTANHESYLDGLGAAASLPDLPTYMKMRSRTLAGEFSILAVQFCQNSFLPSEIRGHPVVQRLNALTIEYIGYIQDIFSYSRELAAGVSTQNLLNVLMASEPGMTLPQAAWKAINTARALAQEFLELEATQLPSWEEEPWASDMRLHVEGLKELMSGYLYWHLKSKRYRHPDAPFPELRDENISSLPEPDSVKLIGK